MAMKLNDWVEQQVKPYQNASMTWLSQYYFFRDPSRPSFTDLNYLFSPADGIILYQRTLRPDECLVAIKGRDYCLRDAMRQPHLETPCLVIGIFMTFMDVHINRVPYPGLLSYKELDPLDTYNHPMLEEETSILKELRIAPEALEYLHHNERVLNRFFSQHLGQSFYVLQIADYEVDCIVPFSRKQNHWVMQGERFSQVRYGSQVDLIVPMSPRFHFVACQEDCTHVQAGLDPLIKIVPKIRRRAREGQIYENSK